MVSSGMSGQKWSQGQCVHSHILLYYLIYYYPAFFVEPLFLILGVQTKIVIRHIQPFIQVCDRGSFEKICGILQCKT